MDRDDQDEKEEILFENHLLRVCSALGQQQDSDYELGDETLGCLRDIKRFLRQDEELKDKASHRLLGKWNILKNDLIPILLKAFQNDDFKLALASCEVMVPITWPIKKNNENLQDLETLKLYKQCFVTKGVWAAILKLLVQIVAIPANEKTENHHARFKLLLLLVRNVLAIDESVSTTKYLDSTIHEDLVSLMHKEELMEILLVLAASSSEIETRAWNSIVLEIFYFVFVNRNCANLLAQAHTPANNSNLGTLLEKEKLNKGKSSRQWRFGGTWSISTGVIKINQGGKSINTRQLPTKQNINFDTVKKQKKRIVIQDTYVEKRFIKPHCRAVFKEIADSFTLNCINELFSSVKREFDMQSTAITLEHHHQFLFLISFFFDYFLLTKSNDNQFDQITGIMNPKIGFYIFAKLYQYKLDKQYDALYYSARALNSFLVVLKEMFKSSIEALNQLAMFIQSAVFYELEHITLISSLCKDSKPRSLIYMKLVMELTENVFDLLQTSNTSQIVTRKKKVVADGDESDHDDGGEAERMRQREKLYTLSRLESTFGQESVIEYYCYLLVDFENLSALDLTNIVKMFNRITNTESLDREALFYKASYLYCFEKVLKSPLMAMENYRELKAILKLICAGAIKRFNEHPELVLELFFSKNRSDCVRIQDGLFQPDSDEIAGERIPTLDEMLIEYKDVDCEDPMAGEYIRKLSNALSKEPNGSEFTRWLSKSMRQVLYDDMDDVVTGQQKQSGIILSYFGTLN